MPEACPFLAQPTFVGLTSFHNICRRWSVRAKTFASIKKIKMCLTGSLIEEGQCFTNNVCTLVHLTIIYDYAKQYTPHNHIHSSTTTSSVKSVGLVSGQLNQSTFCQEGRKYEARKEKNWNKEDKTKRVFAFLANVLSARHKYLALLLVKFWCHKLYFLVKSFTVPAYLLWPSSSSPKSNLYPICLFIFRKLAQPHSRKY